MTTYDHIFPNYLPVIETLNSLFHNICSNQMKWRTLHSNVQFLVNCQKVLFFNSIIQFEWSVF